MVLFSDKEVYKASVVVLLNDKPGERLSTGRLKQVKSGSSDIGHVEMLPDQTRRDVLLHSDVAYLEGKTYQVGRVQRMIKPANRGKIEYRRPINLDEESNSNIILHIVSYKFNNSEYMFSPGSIKIIEV